MNWPFQIEQAGPGDRVLTWWNGLVLAALAKAARVLDRGPSGCGQWLPALSCAFSQPKAIAIVEELDADDTQVLHLSLRTDTGPPLY